MNTPATILVVDDQAENIAVLGELLEADYHVKVATSGEKALRAAAAEPRPDLILLDVKMPDLDGYAVLAQLRHNPVTAGIPVIFVTSSDGAAEEERGLLAGAADYIAKPIKPMVVIARVRTQLENQRAKDWLLDQNAFLETEVRRRIHDNEITQNASLHALAILAETRDNDTGNHILRTQSYVEILAEGLAREAGYRDFLSEEQRRILVKAAPLHDIGKVGIPDRILCKPGKLSAEEFEIMKTHAQIGGDAIALAMRRVADSDGAVLTGVGSPLAFLSVAGQIARSHHERWDGTGYPDRLSGTAIPIAARIMALADVFDALTTKRVYKKAYPVSEATESIVNAKGQHFDPCVVDVFVRSKERFAEIAYDSSDPAG